MAELQNGRRIGFLDQWRMWVELPWLYIRAEAWRVRVLAALVLYVAGCAAYGRLAGGGIAVPLDYADWGGLVDLAYWLIIAAFGLFVALAVVLFPLTYVVGKFGGIALIVGGVFFFGYQLYGYIQTGTWDSWAIRSVPLSLILVGVGWMWTAAAFVDEPSQELRDLYAYYLGLKTGAGADSGDEAAQPLEPTSGGETADADLA